MAGSVGVGASFALNMVFHDTTAEIKNGAAISGTSSGITVEATGDHGRTELFGLVDVL